MSTQTRSKSVEKMLGFLFVLLAVLALSSCSTIIDKMRAKQWEEFYRMMEERNRILQSRLPEGMSFEEVPLSTVLEKIRRHLGSTSSRGRVKAIEKSPST